LPPSDPEQRRAAPLRVAVSDSGPLICLGRLDLLSLLPALFADVQVPDQVLRECAARPANDDAARIAAAVGNGWLTACTTPSLAHGPSGRGERAAIARALAIGAALLTDDREARRYAETLRLDVFGTLGVLVRAKRAGLLPSVSPLIDGLRAGGQRFGTGVVALALAAAGEGPP
jgi:predicted nucleic acid-binding protein